MLSLLLHPTARTHFQQSCPNSVFHSQCVPRFRLRLSSQEECFGRRTHRVRLQRRLPINRTPLVKGVPIARHQKIQQLHQPASQLVVSSALDALLRPLSRRIVDHLDELREIFVPDIELGVLLELIRLHPVV